MKMVIENVEGQRFVRRKGNGCGMKMRAREVVKCSKAFRDIKAKAICTRKSQEKDEDRNELEDGKG